MNEQEAQQAQTIADARKWAAEESAWLSRQKLPQSESVEHMDGVLQIVDSHAQKIEQLNRVGSNTLLALIEMQEKIAEQAKDIERLIEMIANDGWASFLDIQNFDEPV